jgi:subtilisin family serine protease
MTDSGSLAGASSPGLSGPDIDASRRSLPRQVISPLLNREPDLRVQYVPTTADGRSGVLVELDLRGPEALSVVAERFVGLFAEVFARGIAPPVRVADLYFRCALTPTEIASLVAADRRVAPPERTIYRVWPDFHVLPHLDRSLATVKADAAQRTYAAAGSAISWAVVDSGINASSPHFAVHHTLADEVAALHRDFTLPETTSPADSIASALTDSLGHGSHVAGIIAGQLTPEAAATAVLGQYEQALDSAPSQRALPAGTGLSGVAPLAKLVSLKVFADADTPSTSSILLAALHYLRTEVNGDRQELRVQGVNLSLGHPYDPREYGCGQSPLCREVDRLVNSGVVVVVSAGNNGNASDDVLGADPNRSFGAGASITDPANAYGALTVGSAHRTSPHVFGVTYTSSHGPTADGRVKPDLVAPGERITSVAAGAALATLARIPGCALDDKAAAYIEDSGTSMAAPHVSGAVAAFLSVHPEYIGRPEEVRRLFCANAMDLGRDRYYQGAGLVDLMRVLGAV